MWIKRREAAIDCYTWIHNRCRIMHFITAAYSWFWQSVGQFRSSLLRQCGTNQAHMDNQETISLSLIPTTTIDLTCKITKVLKTIKISKSSARVPPITPQSTPAPDVAIDETKACIFSSFCTSKPRGPEVTLIFAHAEATDRPNFVSGRSIWTSSAISVSSELVSSSHTMRLKQPRSNDFRISFANE